MPDQFNKSRSHAKNGHRWRQVSNLAKRRWTRDGTPTCHLCLQPIDTDAPAKSEWSLSCDHIIPVSVRPDLEYTLSNLAPACWQCNVVRQDRPLEEIQRDPKLFRREVEAAIERRDIRRAKTATTGIPANFPPITTWWGNLETPEAHQRRYEQWLKLPPEWR